MDWIRIRFDNGHTPETKGTHEGVPENASRRVAVKWERHTCGWRDQQCQRREEGRGTTGGKAFIEEKRRGNEAVLQLGWGDQQEKGQYLMVGRRKTESRWRLRREQTQKSKEHGSSRQTI